MGHGLNTVARKHSAQYAALLRPTNSGAIEGARKSETERIYLSTLIFSAETRGLPHT